MTSNWLTRIPASAYPFRDVVTRAGWLDLPNGSDGIAFIANALDKHSRDLQSTKDDAVVVEEIGAALALVLLDRFGGECQKTADSSCIRLGSYGFIEPFAAIETALDSASPRRTLVEWLRRAETEAAGTGPISRVWTALASRLQALQNAALCLSATAPNAHTATLSDGTEIDLTAVLRATQGESLGAVDAAVERLVQAVALQGQTSIVKWPEASTRLLPRIVGDAFDAELQGRANLHAHVLCSGLRLAFVLAFEGKAKFVRDEEVAEWGSPDLRETALTNLAARTGPRDFTARDGLWVLSSRDGLDAARILLQSTQEKLRANAATLFALPHRDVLVAAPREHRSQLAHHARDEASRAPHAICNGVFELTHEGFAAA